MPAQKHLFAKYAPNAELHYLDLLDDSIHTWGQNVLKRLPNDEYCVFGLDDYLPKAPLNNLFFALALATLKHFGYDRFELGETGWRHKGDLREVTEGKANHLAFGPTSMYSVSCQFSIWKMSSLKDALSKCSTPWNFEVKGKCKAATFDYPCFRWINESALSKKWTGININGLKEDDVDELVKLGLLDRSKLMVQTSTKL